jgi:hypothetical protein
MGMFDILAFHMELPDFPFRDRRFYTKNLDCCIDLDTGTKSGQLCITAASCSGMIPVNLKKSFVQTSVKPKPAASMCAAGVKRSQVT